MLGETPVALVVPVPGAGTDVVDLIRARCAARLADFKRPREVRLIEALPRILGAKVAKAKLRAMLQEEQAQQ
jgi:crotonobetaine/carnitine-CoA ligase